MILDEHDGINHEDERKLILHIKNKCKVHEQCVVTINMQLRQLKAGFWLKIGLQLFTLDDYRG